MFCFVVLISLNRLINFYLKIYSLSIIKITLILANICKLNKIINKFKFIYFSFNNSSHILSLKISFRIKSHARNTRTSTSTYMMIAPLA